MKAKLNVLTVAIICSFTFPVLANTKPIEYSNKEFIVDSTSDLKVKDGTYVSMNVFNRGYADAALIIYDKSGSKVGVQRIAGSHSQTSTVDYVVGSFPQVYESITDDYGFFDVRDGNYLSETEVQGVIPEGGSFEITKLGGEALAFNALSMIMPILSKFNIGEEAFKSGLKNPKMMNAFMGKLLEAQIDKKLKQENSSFGDDLVKITGIAVEVFIDPKNLSIDKKTILAKNLKKINAYMETVDTIHLGLNISGRVMDMNKFSINDIVKPEPGYFDSKNTTIIKKASVVDKSVLPTVLTNNNQMGSSHLGTAQGYLAPGIKLSTSYADVKAYSTSSDAKIKSGTEQVALAQNTQAFDVLQDWTVTEGDQAKHFSIGDGFGSITAPDPNKPTIAALNNADVQQTTMTKVYKVPVGTKQVNVGMLANFVTNEYPEFVGSQYNDKATIEIKTGSGNIYQATLFDKELNSANFTAVSGLPSPMSGSGGQTGFEQLNKTINVANGGNLTITVKTANVGDMAVPSATLINATSVK